MASIMNMQHLLDNPVWHALNGPQAAWAIGRGQARRYRGEYAPFAALETGSSEAYADLAADLPPGAEARLMRPAPDPLPPGWEHLEDLTLVQMLAADPPSMPDTGADDLVELDRDDDAQIQELVASTQPGPFAARTPELGTYLGVREHGRLIAMAGERIRLPGYVEISAVCTAPQARGRGLAARLVRALQSRAAARGEQAFLHVRGNNPMAQALYERLGFSVRTELKILRRRPARAIS